MRIVNPAPYAYLGHELEIHVEEGVVVRFFDPTANCDLATITRDEWRELRTFVDAQFEVIL